MRMRAKFIVESVTRYELSEQLTMRPVYADKYGSKGETEDNDFARYTPSGELKMAVNNPDLLGKINPGEKYYLDFTKAD